MLITEYQGIPSRLRRRTGQVKIDLIISSILTILKNRDIEIKGISNFLSHHSGSTMVFHIRIDDTDEYQKDFHDFNNNQYRKMPLALEIYLVSKKIDIFISIYQDDWYSIRVCRYRSSEDDDYYSVDNYLADGIDGVNDWIAQFN